MGVLDNDIIESLLRKKSVPVINFLAAVLAVLFFIFFDGSS